MQHDMPGLLPADSAGADVAALEQAADWFAVLRSGRATEHDRTRWQAWHTARAAHRDAWQRVQAISGRITLPPEFAREQRVAAEAALGPAARAIRRRHALKALSAVGGIGAICTIGWTASLVAPTDAMVSARQAEPRTAAAATRTLVLPEGRPRAAFIDALSRRRPDPPAGATAVVEGRSVAQYRLADTDRATALPRAALPVPVHATPPWWPTLGAR